MNFRRLLPHPTTVDIDALLARVTDGIAPPVNRPYTLVNFVESVDGRAAVLGRSGALGDDGDRATFHGLREQVDAVLVGTGTLRAESYGRILGKPERRERRLAAGRTAEPLACIVSRSGQIPTDIPLFAEPEARVIVFSPRAIEFDGCAAQVEVTVLDAEQLTFTAALQRLRTEHAIDTLLCEGGPTVFSALLAEGLVDELFLTLAPKLAGGGKEPAITSGAELTTPCELAIQWLLERNGSLYVRYSLR